MKRRILLVLMIMLVLFGTAVLLKSDDAVIIKNIPYVQGGGERQQLDLYLPKNYKDVNKLPVLVMIHGGGWTSGSKEESASTEAPKLGYAVAAINYRLTSTATFPAQIEDCKAAIRWLRANASTYNLDAEHIGVWGGSAGGHLAALLGTTGKTKEFDVGDHLDQPSDVQAVIDYFGPTDFTIMAEKPEEFAVLNEPVVLLLGAAPKDKPELAAKASPLTYVDQESAPFLIFHGDRDSVVSVDQSIRFEKALKDAGVEVEMFITPGAGHDAAACTPQEASRLLVEFVERHLKPKK